jgi:hypothetical protein
VAAITAMPPKTCMTPLQLGITQSGRCASRYACLHVLGFSHILLVQICGLLVGVIYSPVNVDCLQINIVVLLHAHAHSVVCVCGLCVCLRVLLHAHAHSVVCVCGLCVCLREVLQHKRCTNELSISECAWS